MWTRFMDMHSGGGSKEQWEYIYIEAPYNEAVVIFYNRFGHNPHRVTCTCCGEDYAIDDNEDLEDLTGYDRNCAWEDDKYVEKPAKDSWRSPYMTLEEYMRQKDVLFIPMSDIGPKERIGHVPEQGYVWVD